VSAVKPRVVVVRPDAAEAPLAAEARRVLPEAEFAVTGEDPLRVAPHLPPWQIVLLDRFEGELVRPVNETERAQRDRPEAYLACGAGCPGRCAYCVLPECASVPCPTFHASLDAMQAALEDGLARTPDVYLHLGHILDPLAYPFLGPLIATAVEGVRSAPRARLEIRTKFAAADLLPPDPPPNAVVAFSFAPERLVRLYEQGTASVRARIAAARAAARRGYRIGLRLDPVLIYPGWETDYAALCARLTREIPSHLVADAVLGCFRGPPALAERVTALDPGSVFRRGELIPIDHGKAGYPRPLRVRALRFLASRLGGRFPVSFCFEDETVERDVFGRPS
jgi:spore photoproduct lyase